MLAARNWVVCAPLWVGNSDRLVRSLLFGGYAQLSVGG